MLIYGERLIINHQIAIDNWVIDIGNLMIDD